MSAHGGMNLSAATREWLAAGGTVEPVRRTGEVVYCHASLSRRIRVNGRRKDAPRLLTTALRQLEKRGA